VATSETSPDAVVHMITGGIERVGKGLANQRATGAEP